MHSSFMMTNLTYKSECTSSVLEVELFKFDELDFVLPEDRDRMSLAIFSAATALVSMVLAAFSKAFK